MSAKTNVMRILDANKIQYRTREYEPNRTLSGLQIAQLLEIDPQKMFKTLVTQGKSGTYYVFVIGVQHHLSLKKAAKCVEEKHIEMIRDKLLLPLTGYVHGGCSPIGMKKTLHTVFDLNAKNLDSLFINAGKLGLQVELRRTDLEKVLDVEYFDLIEEMQ